MFFKKSPKIFCISFQRTGTTSVGEFFKNYGFKVGTWDISFKNQWPQFWFEGNFEKIFTSKNFKDCSVFEDGPWWCLNFYKILYHRFPDAKFILFIRNSDKWFDSMMSHSNGKTLGNTYMHCRYYRREKEYYETIKSESQNISELDNLLDINETHRKHYKNIYEIRNRQVLDFFNRNDNTRLIHLQLEDEMKWQKLGKFFNINVDNELDIHANASKND